MRTHVTTVLSSLSCAAVGFLALPAAGAAAADGSPVLPGDVRAVEQSRPSGAVHAHPAGGAVHARGAGTTLPGDLRVLDQTATGGVRAAVDVVSTRVVAAGDSHDLLDVGLGALAGVVVASAVAVAVPRRRPRATTA
ncbi:MAG TPA: hypothetical protein VFL10_19120 [Ornithinibacter sp.]|nr:hypothetical protein [Ornithinibacter sp.]